MDLILLIDGLCDEGPEAPWEDDDDPVIVVVAVVAAFTVRELARSSSCDCASCWKSCEGIVGVGRAALLLLFCGPPPPCEV
jgi:hypothetical protein